jgi:2Fe-2S ferredoxin
MPKVTYRLTDGTEQTVDALAGESLMSIAMDNNIEGILGRCGGECNCGTCHVRVDEDWLAKLPEPSPTEDMMLDGVPAERLPNSRLSCQIKLSSELDGITVAVAETQE